MKKLIIILLINVLSSGMSSFAQGDLLVTPTRIVFEGNRQKETLNLVNMGKDTATYNVSFVQYNMMENGSFEIIEKTDSGHMIASPYLRIFPRKIVLAPGEPQVIMLQCRRNVNMKDGEYRSHLYFRSEKNNTPLGIDNSKKDTTKVSVQLIPIYGISIPIIIRSGSVNISSYLSDLMVEEFPNNLQVLKLTINRTGNISIYGDIVVDYVPLKGKTKRVATIKGVGVYTSINKRVVAIKLDNSQQNGLTNGKLKVRYIENNKSRNTVFSENEIVLK